MREMTETQFAQWSAEALRICRQKQPPVGCGAPGHSCCAQPTQSGSSPVQPCADGSACNSQGFCDWRPFPCGTPGNACCTATGLPQCQDGSQCSPVGLCNTGDCGAPGAACCSGPVPCQDGNPCNSIGYCDWTS